MLNFCDFILSIKDFFIGLDKIKHNIICIYRENHLKKTFHSRTPSTKAYKISFECRAL